MAPKDTSYYELLGVAPTATAAELRKAYRLKALHHHPDRAGDSPEATRAFQHLKAVYDLLRDTARRTHYDTHGPPRNLHGDSDDEGDITAAAFAFFARTRKPVTAADVAAYEREYRDGPDEREDLKEFFTRYAGDVGLVLDFIPYSDESDLVRFVNVWDDAVHAGELRSYAGWRKARKALLESANEPQRDLSVPVAALTAPGGVTDKMIDDAESIGSDDSEEEFIEEDDYEEDDVDGDGGDDFDEDCDDDMDDDEEEEVQKPTSSKKRGGKTKQKPAPKEAKVKSNASDKSKDKANDTVKDKAKGKTKGKHKSRVNEVREDNDEEVDMESLVAAIQARKQDTKREFDEWAKGIEEKSIRKKNKQRWKSKKAEAKRKLAATEANDAGASAAGAGAELKAEGGVTKRRRRT